MPQSSAQPPTSAVAAVPDYDLPTWARRGLVVTAPIAATPPFLATGSVLLASEEQARDHALEPIADSEDDFLM